MKEARQPERRGRASSLHEKLLGASGSKYVASSSVGVGEVHDPGEASGDGHAPPDSGSRTGRSL